jgi:competence protein ComEA
MYGHAPKRVLCFFGADGFARPFGTNAGAAKKKPPLHPINLNTATAAVLQQVTGIGPSTPDKILKMPKSRGPFSTVYELRAIKGVGPKHMEKMRKYLTVGKPAAQRKAKGAGADIHTPRAADQTHPPPTPPSL